MAEFDSAESLPPSVNTDKAGNTRTGSQGDALQLLGRLLVVLLAVVGSFYFASKGVSLTQHYHEIITKAYDAPGPPAFPESGDITVFYTAGEVITSGDRSRIYDPDYFIPEVFDTQGWQRGDPYAGTGSWSKFYNPPFFALILSPLTLFDLHTAYLIIIGINIGAGLLLCYLLGRILHWRQPATVLLPLGLFSFTPLYFVFQHAQPSLLLAVALASSYLFMERGAYKPSALMLIFAALKPQWLALPALVLFQREKRAVLWVVLSGILIIGLPFILVGTRGIGDYLHIVLDRGGGDISDPQFSSASLSWSGFLRALSGEPQPLLWALLAAVTLVVFVFICLSGDIRLSSAGSIIATLLIIPHSHPQDWVVVAVAAAIALGRNAPALSNLGTAACLLGIYFAANDWPNESFDVSVGRHSAYWITPAAATLLLWFGLQPLVESRIASAPWPSKWRFEWQPATLASVRPWQVAGFTFSVGIVLGVAAALALLRQTDQGSGFAITSLPGAPVDTGAQPTGPVDPRFPVALPFAGGRASATAAWSVSGPNARVDALVLIGDISQAAAASAAGLPASSYASPAPGLLVVAPPATQAADASSGGSSAASGASSSAVGIGDAVSAEAQSDGGSDTAEVRAAVSEISSITVIPAVPSNNAAPEPAAVVESKPATSEGIALEDDGLQPDPFSLPSALAPRSADAFAAANDGSAVYQSATLRRQALIAAATVSLGSVVFVARSSQSAVRDLGVQPVSVNSAVKAGRSAFAISQAIAGGQRAAGGLSRAIAGIPDASARGVASPPLGPANTSIGAAAEVTADVALAGPEGRSSTRRSAVVADLKLGSQALGKVIRDVSGVASATLAIGPATGTSSPASDSNESGVSPFRPEVIAGSGAAPDSLAPQKLTDLGQGVSLLLGRSAAVSQAAGLAGGAIAQNRLNASTSAVRGALTGLSAEIKQLQAMQRSAGLSSVSQSQAQVVQARTRVQALQSALPGWASAAGQTLGSFGRRLTVRDLVGSTKAVRGILDGISVEATVAGKSHQNAALAVAVAQQARAEATAKALVQPTAIPTPVERTDCAEIRATGARTPREANLLATTCAPPPTEPAAPPPQPQAPAQEARAPAPPQPPAPPAPAKCTRVVAAKQPSVTPLGDGGLRIDAELSPSDPAGCSEWPAAFSASANISITSGSAVYQGTWSCESGRNNTAGVPASTHFVFFCSMGSKSGSSAGSSSFTINVTALSESGAVSGTSAQSFPVPSLP